MISHGSNHMCTTFPQARKSITTTYPSRPQTRNRVEVLLNLPVLEQDACGCLLALHLALNLRVQPFLLSVYLVGAAQTAQLCRSRVNI